mmetsp:Transcript_15594/g.22914  ORF Transcript_15594/g.22914 Transcript_15594/m.22914 type:complete len:356 (-) Transcript_15594:287-1354(-)
MLVNLALISVQLGFSGWHIVGKVALNAGVDPLALALYREALGTALMFLLASYATKQSDAGQNMKIQRKHWLRFLALGLFSFGNVVGCIVSLKFVSATNFAVMQPSIPVLATGISVFWGLETISTKKIFGIVLSVAGAVVVESTGGLMFGKSSSYGSALVMLQCLSMALLTVAQKPVLATYHSTVVTAWYYAVGSALTLVTWAGALLYRSSSSSGSAGLLVYAASSLSLGGKVSAWLALLYVGVVATFYCYNALAWALARTTPSKAAAFNTLQPPGTVILSVMFLHSSVHAGEVLGGILVIAGLLVTLLDPGGAADEARMISKSNSLSPVPTRYDEPLILDMDMPGATEGLPLKSK